MKMNRKKIRIDRKFCYCRLLQFNFYKQKMYRISIKDLEPDAYKAMLGLEQYIRNFPIPSTKLIGKVNLGKLSDKGFLSYNEQGCRSSI